MRILNDYDGSSIYIIHNDDKKNIAIVSLKKEENTYCHYYNFKVINDLDKEGIIYLKNMNNSLYYRSDNYYIPFIKIKDQYQLMDSRRVRKENNDYIFTIDSNLECEISLYPRYVEEDLNKYLLKVKNYKDFNIINDIIPEIRIGDFKNNVIAITGRQHPGETISSFFIEGIIDAVIENKEQCKDYSFIIFPIVNKDGVKNGNHRYVNNIDYNRSWGNNCHVKEIDFIKKELSKNIPDIFIDIHGDENSLKDYIRTTNHNRASKVADMLVLKDQSKLRRFLRGIIKQRKIINVFKTTAREYVSKKCCCEGMLIELSLRSNTIDEARKKGYQFILEVIGGKNDE